MSTRQTTEAIVIVTPLRARTGVRLLLPRPASRATSFGDSVMPGGFPRLAFPIAP
jgi:hypothetical protein